MVCNDEKKQNVTNRDQTGDIFPNCDTSLLPSWIACNLVTNRDVEEFCKCKEKKLNVMILDQSVTNEKVETARYRPFANTRGTFRAGLFDRVW